MTTPTDRFRDCIAACSACAEACERCASECLNEGDIAQLSKCIRLTRDCADLCFVAAQMMSRGSTYARDLCQISAALCGETAEECARHDHEHCQQAAATAARCGTECQRVSA